MRTVGGLPVGRAAGAEADECEILCAVLERMDQPAAPGQAVIADKSYFGAAFQDQLTRAGAHAGAGPARVSGFRGRRNRIGRLRRAGGVRGLPPGRLPGRATVVRVIRSWGCSGWFWSAPPWRQRAGSGRLPRRPQASRGTFVSLKEST